MLHHLALGIRKLGAWPPHTSQAIMYPRRDDKLPFFVEMKEILDKLRAS